MSAATVLAVVFTAVSSLSLTWYLVAAYFLHQQPPSGDRRAYRGLLRTAYSRVGAASMYVALGVTSLVAGPRLYVWLPTLVFTLVQFVWQSNSLLDLRLKRQLLHDAGLPSSTPRSTP